jgi:rubrerythrin
MHSRRLFLVGAVSALAGACGADETPRLQRPGVSGEDIAALNEALAFEHLEAAFYAQAAQEPRLTPVARELLERFATQEADHVATLTRSIRDAGGRPVAAPPRAGAPADALETALALEELRAAAYLDQLGRIANAGLLAVALSIHAVEARQVVALRGLTGRVTDTAEALGEPLAIGAAIERARELVA